MNVMMKSTKEIAHTNGAFNWRITMKKTVLTITLLIATFFTLTGCSYYKDTYQGTTYYAVVPETVPEKEVTLDNQGKEVAGSFSYKYTLNWADAKGNTKEFDVEIAGDSPENLVPGSFVKAEISEKRIVEGPNYIEMEEIPAAALEKIQ